MKTKNVKIISVQEWDKLIEDTYGRPYNFQQQGGCKDRRTEYFSVPHYVKYNEDDFLDSIPEVVNTKEMCVRFSSWLARDPKQKLAGQDFKEDYRLTMWWERNFYPPIEAVIEDLHKKGLLEQGDYGIDIDW